MKSRISALSILTIVIMVTACEKPAEKNDYQPVSEFVMSPDTGNTTTIFKFDASASIVSSLEDNPVFLRWDWEGDGNWDKMYTTGSQYTHRFYRKGTYKIALEAATLFGRKDTSYFTITIPQGYSPPRAEFIVSPDSANIFTEFIFDASYSKDDEDSLNQLLFRWDFEGDLIWDTEFSYEPIAKFYFAEQQLYPSRLEVKDPQEMRNIATFDLKVTRLNDQVVPAFTSECWPCTLEDTIRFDASESYIIGDSEADMTFSWDIFADNIWESENSSSPLFSYNIPFDGNHKIKLRVTDKDGLYMETVSELEIFPLNTPPTVILVLGNRYGNPSSTFYLHGKESIDRETGYLDMKIQWDLNDDGIWDSEFNDQREVWTTFDQPGDYPVMLKMTDTQDKWEIAYDTIRVFPGNYETDILEDKRGFPPQYYGTVKIGNTWWTQNNSRYVPPSELNGGYNVDTYKNQYDSVYLYGHLYPYFAITHRFNPCAKGWRVPSLEDWDQMMNELGPDVRLSDMLVGGSSELHISLSGYKEFGSYVQKGRIVHYYTTTSTITGHPYLWYIDKLLNKNKSVIASRSYSLPVRCVKDD